MTEPAKKKSLHQLAVDHGQISPPVPEGSPYLMAHRVASIVHNWTHHETHYGPVELTDEDYEAALAAASVGVVPHKPAVPEVPTEEEISAKHKAAYEASSEPDAVEARAKLEAKQLALEAADKQDATSKLEARAAKAKPVPVAAESESKKAGV